MNIEYEILRRDDGLIALSIRSGVLPEDPKALLPEKYGSTNLLVLSAKGRQLARLVNAPQDCITQAHKANRMELFEFGSLGMTGGHALAWQGRL